MPRAETDTNAQSRVAAFREGLQQLGWTEGRELGRIINEDLRLQPEIWCPVGQEIEQHGVVRLTIGRRRRMRPVASPHHALGRELDERACNLAPIGISWRTDLGEDVGAGQLHPGGLGFDQICDDAKEVAAAVEWQREA